MGKKRHLLGLVGLALTVALVAAGCGGGKKTTTPGGGAAPTKGGVYRTAIEDFGFTDAFDPTGEYLGAAWDLFQALTRTLINYKHTAGPAGNVLYPDLAQSMPTVSPDGLTYTFKLKPNIKFGPPVNRAITSKDIEYAFERLNDSKLLPGYSFYYGPGVIKGFTGKATSPQPIPGIETPDDQTIIFHLEKPIGDFLYRLSLPATAPIPREVASCFDNKPAGTYGRYVISSGPYMIQGSDKLNDSSCSTLKPISGFDPSSKMILVRNPNYDQSTDNLRSNYVDGIDIRIDTNTDDIFNKIEAGSLDGTYASTPPPTVQRAYTTDPSKKNLLKINSADRTWYLVMNMAVPPTDDVHVRKAINYVLDKAAMLQAWGGPTAGTIAEHIIPPVVIGGLLGPGQFNPYGSPDNHGDVAKAQAEMKLSKYDSNHDGMCDASVCNNLLMINRNYGPWKAEEPSVVAQLAKIGIKVKVQELATSPAYQAIQTPKNKIALGLNVGWGKDYGDAFTFAFPLFDSQSILAANNSNMALVGLTPAIAKSIGIPAPAQPLPSVDSDIDNCEKIPATEASRNQCWAALDQKLMNDVVPWAPYLWANVRDIMSTSVTKYDFDQFSGQIAFTQVAVNNGLKPAAS